MRSKITIKVVGSMDAGGGACLLVQDGQKRPIVFDCGASPGNRNGAVMEKIIRTIIALQPELMALTHFHYDHWGSIPRVFDEMNMRGIPYPTIVSSDMSFELLRQHIPGWDCCDRPVRHLERTSQLEMVPSKHSMPGSAGVLFHGRKNIFYTGDCYGIDIPSSFPEIDFLVVDSTGAMRDEPRVDNEDEIRSNIMALISETLRGNRSSRVYVALLSTKIERASYLHKKIKTLTCLHPAIKGASLLQNTDIFMGGIPRTGFKSRVTLLTGVWAQGESKWFREDASALVRIANGNDWGYPLREGDLVILSGSIPTWSPPLMAQIKAMCLKLRTRGARVVVDTTAPESWANFSERKEIHAGGHGNMPEIADLIARIQPKLVLPFHADRMAREKVALHCKQQGILSVPDDALPVITL